MLTCLIIDDEPLARKGLQEYIRDVDFLRSAGEFDNPLRAIDTLLHQPVDLIFLDIEMPKMTGLDFWKTLSHPPMVIFTTAYPQYAVEGFNLDAVDYLLKPFSFERFWKAVVKAKVRLEGQTATNPPVVGDIGSLIPGIGLLATESASGGAPAAEQGYFFIKCDNRLQKIRYDDILFVEALRNYITVHTPNKKYITYLTISNIEENLPPEQFLRVHKSFIVSLLKIDSIEGNMIRVGAHTLPIGRATREEVLNKILNNRFWKR